MGRGRLLSTYVRVIERLGGVRTNLRRVLGPLYVRIEAAAAMAVAPRIGEVVRGLHASRESLTLDYEAYTRSVSVPIHAISLETASFLDSWCSVHQPKSVLDLGSGFTSFVFRRYQRTVNGSALVKTVDDDLEWLTRTRDFLTRSGLSTENMSTLAELGDSDDGEYDFVCYDLGNLTTRSKWLSKALSCVRPLSGVIVIDDFHIEPYRTEALVELQRRHAERAVIREITLDSFGRYSMLATHLNPQRGAGVEAAQAHGGKQLQRGDLRP